ncbi:MAG: tetratricopeptide repeat protein [Candidatus Omnitrophica bacterium]|nr:tetratricopeptide repeat protein [Candidatus Omnitrophota bacterium]
MKKNKSTILSNVLLGFIVLSLAGSIFLDYRQHQQTQARRLVSQLNFADLLTLENEKGQIPSDKIEAYLQYFQSVINTDNSQADAHAMAGFCYYHLGQKDKALASYERAVSLNPKFLWFHYNLAVIYFEQGQYREALAGFQRALMTNPSDNALFLRNFKIFVYIIYKAQPLKLSFGERLKRGYGVSAYFAALCAQKLGDEQMATLLYKQSQSVGIKDQDIQPRLYVF